MKRTVLIILALTASTFAAGDDANPYHLHTTKALSAWRTRQHSIDAEAKRHQQALQQIDHAYLANMTDAKTAAAHAGNADEIVRIDKAMEGVGNPKSVDQLIGTTWAWGQDGRGTIRFLPEGKTTDAVTWSRIDDHRIAIMYDNGAVDIAKFNDSLSHMGIMFGPRHGAANAFEFDRK